MITEVQTLIDQYLVWLRDITHLRQIKDWVEITTPYLDRHYDYLLIYAKKENGSYLLTDDGSTIEELEQSGCNLAGKNRQDLLKMTLNGFGVQLEKGELRVLASPENFSLRKHNLVQAMLAVNDMFYVAAARVANLFDEDVVAWLEMNDIRYIPKIKFTGKSGLDHLFDFVIPKSRKKPERILQTINRPNRENAQVVAFSWIDTREVRSPDSKAFAILNDSQQAVSSAVIDALKNYDVHPVTWSQRESVREELAA